MKKALMGFVAVAIAACSAPGAGINGSPMNTAYRATRPDDFSLHPPRIRFATPSDHLKIEHVRGFGFNGAIAEDCLTKGVAEVAGDGLRGQTLIAFVLPIKAGRCEATFTDGAGAKLRLPVVVE
jgi:hypothetical protein